MNLHLPKINGLFVAANANAAWRAQANLNANANDYANSLGKIIFLDFYTKVLLKQMLKSFIILNQTIKRS